MHARGKPAASPGPREWFTGDVTITSVAQGHESNRFGVALVHFPAGARTAWHSHSLGQTLHVTEGSGTVQSRGGERIRIGLGDIIEAAPGEWHWHGAAAVEAMTHLAVSEGEPTWGDHVTDEEYGSA